MPNTTISVASAAAITPFVQAVIRNVNTVVNNGIITGVGLSAVSTGQFTLRVTFAQPVVRVPTLGLTGAWSVRRTTGGQQLIVVAAVPSPGIGAVTYVDLTTQLEQSAGATDIVEFYGIEAA